MPSEQIQAQMMQVNSAVSADFYDHHVTQVAADLLGKLLCRRSRHGLTVGRIVETEAYLAEGDSASHSFKSVNRRNAAMFGPPGRAYVYTIHARQCVNVVTEPAGVASAVLIRAVEPLTGIDLMQRRRRTNSLRDLCRGPARLCEAFEIGRSFDGWPLVTPKRLWIAREAPTATARMATSARIGVTSAYEQQLRFFVPNNRSVSGPRSLNVSDH